MVTISFTKGQIAGLIFSLILIFVFGGMLFRFIKDDLADDIDWILWFITISMYTIGVAAFSGIIF